MTPKLRTNGTGRSCHHEELHSTVRLAPTHHAPTRRTGRARRALAAALLCMGLLAPTAGAIEPVPNPEEEPDDLMATFCLRDTLLRSFTATPQSLTPPATSTTVQWEVTVPSACKTQGWQLFLSGQLVPAVGSRVLTPPPGGATYTLTARMDSQSKSLGTKTVSTWQCNPPVIGWEDGGFAPFLNIKPQTITVQYHDQCTAEDWTKVYGRQGASGAFTLLKQDGANSGGWRTAVHNNLLPETTYCYKVQTSKAGVVKESSVHCQATPKPACPAPVIGTGGKELFLDSTPTSLTAQYHDQCTNDVATKVYARKSTVSAWTLIRSDGPNGADWRTATYNGLLPDTEYCFQVVTTGPDTYPHPSAPRCTTTPAGFVNEIPTAAEAQQVFEAFTWHHTTPLSTGSTAQPALFYTNVLVHEAPAVQALQAMGVHIQASPVFPEELDTWQEEFALVTQQGVVTGRWYFAVMPAAIYNKIRTESLKALANKTALAFPAVVMRTIPVSVAREGGHPYRLSYQYLGEQGFAYNGATSQSSVATCVTMPDDTLDCDGAQPEVGAALFGWLGRFAFELVDGLFDAVVEGVRKGIGFFTAKVKGEISLPLAFTLYNTDPLFLDAAGKTPLMSGWRGQEITLTGVRVQVRQGLALFTGTTDAAGKVTINVAKNLKTRVCVEAENRYAKLTGFLDTELVCLPSLGSFGSSPTTPVAIEVHKPTLQVLAQITDAAEYVRTRLHHTMEKITVLVGTWADRASIISGHAFAPCMGRMPNLPLGLAADLVSVLLGPLSGDLPVGFFAEFLAAVDIVMPTADLVSRGVGVHEYGHAVMCSLLARQGFDALQTAWTEVIFASGSSAADNDTRYIAEGFADFLTAQVVGGTNYFAPSFPLAPTVACDTRATDPFWRWSENIHYCIAAPCVEGDAVDNYHEDHRHCMDATAQAFQAQVRRVASLLHDAFDGHTGLTAVNTGIHWEAAPSGKPAPSDTYLVHNLISMGADDDPVSMAGSCLADVFKHWDARGNFLAESTFLGALADTLRADGYDESEVCGLFEKHSATGTCPAYAQNSSVRPGFGCSSRGGSGGNGGIGSGTDNDPDTPPLHQN